jgi:hypothetical protein
MQTLATMAAYSVPVLAPAIARDLGVDGALTGYFVSVIYGVGIASSLTAASLIHTYGAVRIGQKEQVQVTFMFLKEEATLNIDAYMHDAQRSAGWHAAAPAVAPGSSNGPPGAQTQLLHSQTLPVSKGGLSWFAYSGKRAPAAGWPKGRYVGSYILKRDGATIVQQRTFATIP